ncbi:MAG: hypothetical protein AB1345_14690, partial [Chloroflexota bacterium]
MTDSYFHIEKLTRKWWFYLLLFLIPALSPCYVSTGLGYYRNPLDFILQVTEALYWKKYIFQPLMPAAHLTVILLILLLVRMGNRFGRLFSTLVGCNFLIILYVQTMVNTEKYGFVVATPFFILFLMVALVWFWEASSPKTDFTFRWLPIKKYWVVPMALFAFWDPDQAWYLDMRMWLISTSPIAFCMMTTVYLATFSLLYPNINLPAFR